jgi:ATP-dependent RNA helicase RhlE
MANVFDALDERLRKAIADVGYETPTPIQDQAIPYLLEGRDLIGCAQTGTGKTAAFLLPILHRLVTTPAKAPCAAKGAGHPRALILSPTRELAAQTAHNLVDYSKYTRTHYAIVFGGVSQFLQVKDLQRGAEVVVATPGRLIDLMTQGVVYLDRIEEFVLDEADRMLDMGFFPDIRRIIGKLPATRHSMFFSATLSPQIRKLAGELVVDPMQIMISPERPTVDKISQHVMCVEKGNKDNLLLYLLGNHPEWNKVIVFARTRHGADRVERKLRRADVKVAAIHSDKTQSQRTRALDGFRDGRVRVLVATDIASRGIDVPEVDLVVNMELPDETESYVHRIGRTARAGESGTAISFVSPEERFLLKSVERFIRQSIPVDRDQPFHSEIAEKKAGKTGQGAPQAPWIRGGRENRNGKPRHQGGFQAGGGKKKFKHPANMHRHRRNRPNFKGRGEPDFRKGGE